MTIKRIVNGEAHELHLTQDEMSAIAYQHELNCAKGDLALYIEEHELMLELIPLTDEQIDDIARCYIDLKGESIDWAELMETAINNILGR